MNRRIEQIRALLRGLSDVEGILVETQTNFAWLTGGRCFIGAAGSAACASILITRERAYLLSNNIECERLLQEELPPGLEAAVYPWHEPNAQAALLHNLCGSYQTDTQLSEEFFALRTILDEEQIADYRRIAPQIAGALETVMRALRPGVTELETAGRLAERCWAMRVEPITLLVGFDERMRSFRHPLPTERALEKLALGAVAVRYKGLYISCTRQISVGRAPQDMVQKHRAVEAVDAAVIRATVPGRSMAELFAILQSAYAREGWPEEWRLHHQGGLSGFTSREAKAMPGSRLTVAERQAFAWNPTIRGAKSEDTILVAAGGNEILTHTGEWDYETYEGIPRPVVLAV